ncbi:histone deacetylase [Gracilaria domingensis]|nr:histone deacetylase [Gracilaria domingensis]
MRAERRSHGGAAGRGNAPRATQQRVRLLRVQRRGGGVAGGGRRDGGHSARRTQRADGVAARGEQLPVREGGERRGHRVRGRRGRRGVPGGGGGGGAGRGGRLRAGRGRAADGRGRAGGRRAGAAVADARRAVAPQPLRVRAAAAARRAWRGDDGRRLRRAAGRERGGALRRVHGPGARAAHRRARGVSARTFPGGSHAARFARAAALFGEICNGTWPPAVAAAPNGRAPWRAPRRAAAPCQRRVP